ncbi:MAG: hypothetical protein ACTSU5_21675, partial [Promethearchaeota archaeon]
PEPAAPPSPEPAAPPPGATLEPVDQELKARLDAFEVAIHQPKANPRELAGDLSAARDFILENKGFSMVLNDVKNWVTQMKRKNRFDPDFLKAFRKKLAGWREHYGLGPGPEVQVPEAPAAGGAGVSPVPTPSPSPGLAATPQRPTPASQPKPTPPETAGPPGAIGEALAEVDNFILQVDKSPPQTFGKALDFLADYLQDSLGGRAALVAREIREWAKKLKGFSQWSEVLRADMKRDLEGWKARLSR